MQADGRAHKAGLGSRGSAPVRGHNPNESYKDCVKRTLFSRFKDDE